jgi:hypothetical protein
MTVRRDPSDPLSSDELLTTIEAARSPDEIRAAIHLLAVYLQHYMPDETLRHAFQEMMQRAEAMDLQFGRPHTDPSH